MVAIDAMNQLLVVSPSSRALQNFTSVISSGDREVWFSYGEFIPALEDGFLFWGAGKFALSLKQLFPERSFSSPGAEWLGLVPPELSGRSVICESFLDAVAHVDEPVWFKFAELKHDGVKPRSYRPEELLALLVAMPELAEVKSQWTTSHLRLNFEHRFFVVEGEVLTGSPYHVDAVVGFEPGAAWRMFSEAEEFARFAARELVDQSPRAYTLDVALNEATGKWFIVEANRAWSSGLYGCDPGRALVAVQASLTPDAWSWLPDSVVGSYVSPLTVVQEPEFVPGILRVS